MTASFWEYTEAAIREELRRIAQAPDVYLATVFLWTAPSTDVRWSAITLRWDTERRCAARSAGEPERDLPGLRWSWQHHARSDHAWWDRDMDPAGHEALERWARGQGLWFDGDRDRHGDAETELGLELSYRLVDGLIAIIRGLHADGTIASEFGRAIPITLVPHDSHQPYAEWNEQANPPELYAHVGAYYESISDPG